MDRGSETWVELTHSAGIVAGQLAQLHAALVVQAAQMIEQKSWAGDGIRSPEHWLQVYTGLAPAQANAIVRVAKRSSELRATVEWMQAGRISLDQADAICSRIPAEVELEVLEVAEYLSVAQLRRVLARYSFDPTGVALPHEPEPRRPQLGSLSMYSADGRFRLNVETDAVVGAVIEAAIREAKDALFSAGHAEATLVDGLVEVANRSLSAVAPQPRSSRYRILVHLDTAGNGWLGRRGALPKHIAERYTCDGVVVPVWETEGVPVSVGRSQRIIPERTRRLVEDRDKGCRFPGCAVVGYLENHHIVHWSHGGSTDLDSVVSLCSFHHDSHHRGEFSIEGSPATFHTLIFRTRGGMVINAPRPEPPPLEVGPPPWNLDRGLPISEDDFDLRPRRNRFSPPERTAQNVEPAPTAREVA